MGEPSRSCPLAQSRRSSLPLHNSWLLSESRSGRGRVIAETTVLNEVITLSNPPTFGGRLYPLGCRLEITGFGCPGQRDRDQPAGAQDAPLPQPDHLRAASLRTVLAPLDTHDAKLLHEELAPVLEDKDLVIDPYLERTAFASAHRD